MIELRTANAGVKANKINAIVNPKKALEYIMSILAIKRFAKIRSKCVIPAWSSSTDIRLAPRQRQHRVTEKRHHVNLTAILILDDEISAEGITYSFGMDKSAMWPDI